MGITKNAAVTHVCSTIFHTITDSCRQEQRRFRGFRDAVMCYEKWRKWGRQARRQSTGTDLFYIETKQMDICTNTTAKRSQPSKLIKQKTDSVVRSLDTTPQAFCRRVGSTDAAHGRESQPLRSSGGGQRSTPTKESTSVQKSADRIWIGENTPRPNLSAATRRICSKFWRSTTSLPSLVPSD